jgi:hypothetical protein
LRYAPLKCNAFSPDIFFGKKCYTPLIQFCGHADGETNPG